MEVALTDLKADDYVSFSHLVPKREVMKFVKIVNDCAFFKKGDKQTSFQISKITDIKHIQPPAAKQPKPSKLDKINETMEDIKSRLDILMIGKPIEDDEDEMELSDEDEKQPPKVKAKPKKPSKK